MDLAELRSLGLLELLDVELARSLGRAGKAVGSEIELAIALTSRNVRRGHTCFPLGSRVQALWTHDVVVEGALPDIDRWTAQLRASALTDGGPLVLDEKARLYLRRYWQMERDVAEGLRARAAIPPAPPSDETWVETTLDRLFPRDAGAPQRQAAWNALVHRVSLLCGGPGTGKTTTVAAIVAMIVERDLHETQVAPKVVLLAPTGKAAARLGEAVLAAKGRITASDEVLDCIPSEAATVHRALGMQREGMRFQRHAELPLEADVIVLDEASMIDLALMRQLLDAAALDATILIVGDPDQLTSVEAGSVLRDLVDANDNTWWRGRVTHLTKTWRYDETRPLGELVRAIRGGDADHVDALLTRGGSPDIVWAPHDELPSELDRAASRWTEALSTTDAATHFERRGRYVILTPFRRGPVGTGRLGAAIQERLRAIGPEPPVTPIIVEENSQELGVFNGDFAMLKQGELPSATVQSDSGRLREIAEARLPRYSDAYALTVHKSQGSEFDEVVIVLPEQDAPLLTRELLYTAVSRARKRVRIVGPKEVVLAALERRARRDSGLVDAIAEVEDRSARGE